MGQIKIQDDRLCHIKLNRNLIEMSTDFDGILYTVDLKGRYVAKEIKNLKMADSCHIENDFFGHSSAHSSAVDCSISYKFCMVTQKWT